MRTVIKNDYSPQIGDYCETIVVDRESEKAYIFDCDGVWTELPQPIDIEKFLKEAKNYTDEVAETKVDKVEGKELSSNDFTDELKDKLDSIAYGAQENVIESIKVNGKGVAVIDKAVNINVPTKVSQLENDEGYINDLSDYYTEEQVDELIGSEANVREIMDESLQEQIDAIAASSDVIDIVGTKAALDAYDKSKVHDNDIIKVLNDETRDHATTYYRFNASTQTWGYVGAEGPFYTKAEADGTFVPLTRTVNGKALSSNITLNAGDVGAATTGALAAEAATRLANDEALQTQIDEATGAIEELDASKADKSEIPTTVAELTDSANYVKFTDTATASKAGVIKVTDAYATQISDSGELKAKVNTYSQYGSMWNDAFISKGTLENVLAGKELQSKSDVENLISGKADKSEIKNPADYYWANVKVSDSSKTNTAPEFAQIKTTGGNFPHIKGNGTNLTLSPSDWTQGKGGVVVSDDTFRPSQYKNKGMSLGQSGSLWANLYMDGSIYKGTYQQQLQNKAGTIALTSDIPTNISSFTNDAGYLTNSALANYYTKDETYTQQEVNSLINSYSIPKASATTLGGIKVGNNLSIDANGVLSADAQSITVDSALSTTSTNPAQNKVITEAINGKNKTIYTAYNLAPTADTTAAWKTLLGGDGIYVTWYNTASKFAYQPAQYGFLVTYIGSNDIRQEFYKQNDGITFLRSGNSTGWAVIDGESAGEFRRLGNTVDKALSTTSYNPVRNSVVTAKINEIDRFYRGLVPATKIENGSDLNTPEFLRVGKYYTKSNNDTATLMNCPVTDAFMLEVTSPISQEDIDKEGTATWVQRLRILTTYKGQMYTQICSSNGTAGNFTYNSWTRFAKTSDIGNGTLTIQKNGTNVDTFTANATSNKTVNITVPTKTSDLTNDSGFVTDVSGFVKKSGDTMTGNLGIRQAGATDVYLSMGASNRTDTQIRSSTAGNTLIGNSNTGATGVFIRPQGVSLGTNETVFYKDGSIKVSNKITNLTAGTADTDAVNYGQIKNLATVSQATYTAGDHISIENNVVTAEDYVHSENPLASISPTNTLAGSNITNSSIAFDKTVPGDFLKLQLTTVDPGEGSPLAANTILGVYQ